MKKRKPSTATDHIYLHRAVTFKLADGRTISSIDENFQQIPLGQIVEMRLKIRNQEYPIHHQGFHPTGMRCDRCLPPSFVEFIHFRTTGRDYKVNPHSGLYELQRFDSWSIGWTDGIKEYLVEVDFQTGAPIGSYERPCRGRANPSHYHPQSRILERGIRA